MSVEISIENGVLTIEIPMEKPRPSATGKSLILATTHGRVTTELTYRKKPVVVSANAFIYAHDHVIVDPSGSSKAVDMNKKKKKKNKQPVSRD